MTVSNTPSGSNAYATMNDLDSYSTLVATPTNGDILITNGDGQPTDSGKAFNDAGTTTSDIWSADKIGTAINAAKVGLWNDRGVYDASVNTFPAAGGSGTAGAILKGDIWTASVAGTLGSVAVNIGDTIRALADTPGQTAGNWALGEGNIGYVPENIVNKKTDLTSNSDTYYPTVKAVNTAIAGLTTNSLTSAYIFVGNSSNIAVGVAVSGDIGITNTGSVTVNKIKNYEVDLTGIADGDAITWDATNSKFVMAESGSVASVNGQTGTVVLTKSDVGLGNVTNILDKLDATAAPTANDDSGDGYSIGSKWADVTNDKIYFCVDATLTAAIWQEVGDATIADNSITNAKLAQMAADTVKANITGSTANTADVAKADFITWLDISAPLVPDLEFDNADLTAGVLTVSGVKTIASIVDNAGAVIIPDSITYATNTSVNILSYGTITGTWKVKFAQGLGADSTINNNYYTNYGDNLAPFQIPLDYDETAWSLSTRPTRDVISGIPVMRFDYSTAEYAGVITMDAIPTGSTNLVVRVTARPYSTAASGTNMGWGIKYIRLRDNTAATSIATQVLGSTAFQTSGAGDTTATYTIALSTLSVQAGDILQILLYANTGVATPKQTDWMITSVKFGVS